MGFGSGICDNCGHHWTDHKLKGKGKDQYPCTECPCEDFD